LKAIKILTLIIVLLALAAPTLAQSEDTSAKATSSKSSGRSNLKGWGLGLGIHDGDFGFHGRKDFWLGGDISHLTGQAGVFFHGKTTFKLDADYHFIINPGSPSRFYPLVGLQFGFNSDNAKLGANLGGGANFMLTESLASFAELKYVVGDWDGLTVQVGLYF